MMNRSKDPVGQVTGRFPELMGFEQPDPLTECVSVGTLSVEEPHR